MRKLQWSNGEINVLGIIVCETDQEMIEKNLDPIFGKMQALLNIRLSRDLSIIGKIAICNTLVASQLVYRLTVLPQIPRNYVDCFNKMIGLFIWNGKKAKINLEVLQGNKDQGGLGLVNLKIKDQALKISWLFRLENDPMLKTLAYDALENNLDNLTWKCNTKAQDIVMITTRKSFWRDVWTAWANLTCENLKSCEQIKAQTIWLNSNILVQKKPIRWTSWIHAAIVTIQDLMSENDLFYTHDELMRKYNIKIPFTEFLGIHRAIPQMWKNALEKKQESSSCKNWYEVYSKVTKVTGLAYHDLNDKGDLLFKIVQKWHSSGKNLTVTQESLEASLTP